ncbi:MAG: 50S ribosomal protein L4 [archaeon]
MEQTMKTSILTIDGKEKEIIELPGCFSKNIREDIVARVLELQKTRQPYAPSLVAGSMYSASGKIVHRRKVWKSQYGRGMSRIPRKIMSRRGTQFNWVGATIPSARGGRRAHPPKTLAMINTKKINKKELKIALVSALSATASEKFITKRYSKLKDKKIEKLPFVVESKFTSLKTKDMLKSLEKILGKELFEIAVRKKSVRSGKGKLRGRKYKSSAGLLFVTGKDEKLKTTAFEIANVKRLGIKNLAKGGLGRLTVYTKNAIKNLEELK